ncbi:MAG: hypothetical protein LJU34_06040 [Oscillospiraceae bacterium]|nr:hypothetical protein [Oscillospiraceae bacterium]
MVSYVYDHQELLLLNGEPKPRNMAGLKENGYKSLAAQIILAEEIATLYEVSCGYFKANSRFCIEKVPQVIQFERLQYVMPSTLGYIASHPEQLLPNATERGIRIGSRTYQPKKALSLQSTNSYDIYENRVILGFLRKMIDEVDQLRSQSNELLKKIPQEENYNADYIYSSFFMFAETRHTLENGIHQLSNLYDRYTRLWGMYQSIFHIPAEEIISEPKPTQIFLSVPQYNKVFVRIHQWSSFGVYSFEKEKHMLSFVKISSLYESYLLVKMLSYFTDHGYTLLSAKRCTYPVVASWKYQNTRCANTFNLSNGKSTITLYYQPVVFDTDRRKVNGIGLYRNNSIAVYTGEDDARRGGHYYTPDYIVKLDINGVSKYLILDAKFSDRNSVKSFYVKDLAFKYLFSISPIDVKDFVLGMCIIYGKCSERDSFESAYDKQMLPSAVVPIADLLPLIEGIAARDQNNKFDQLFKKLLG